MEDHAYMTRIYLAEARSRHGNPAQRAFVAQLVRWARDRHHRYIKASRAGQQELPI